MTRTELLISLAPVLLGSGTRLFDHIGSQYQLERIDVVPTPNATTCGSAWSDDPSSTPPTSIVGRPVVTRLPVRAARGCDVPDTLR